MVTEEGRSLKRRHLIYYLEVYDQDSGELLGHLVDITTKGCKLVSKRPIEVGKHFNLQMVLPEDYFQTRSIKFKAESLWSSNDINPDFFDTGFKVEDISHEASDIIISLINQLGFNN